MSKRLRVLIVEDSEDDAELLVNQLERSGYNSTYQRVDSRNAMNVALEKQHWDIVLADYSLPRFSATAALTLLQEKKLDLPFIIVSGSIADGTAVAAMKAGAHDYIMKDNLTRLVPAIERELEEVANRRERQRIQSELKESEDRWQLALRGNNDGIWDWNIKNNTVFFSARWKEMLGYSDDEIANRFDEWEKRVHPDDFSWVTEALQNHLAGKTQFYQVEHRLRCKDGTYKWILARAQALWDEVGDPVRIVGSHTDITPTKQMEEALRQQAETLAQANRLKDEFLAVVSHELRTPLNSILGWAQVLCSRKLDEATTARALQTIERNANLQRQLVEDLLDVSRIIQGKLSLTVCPTNLVLIIEAAIETMQAAVDAKGIELKFLIADFGLGNIAESSESLGADEFDYLKSQIQNPKFLVMGDAGRLQQVVWNLLSNAIKFTPQGGKVQIQLTRIAENVEIAVSDTGIGIKPEFLPYVFDRFRQENSSTTRTYGGLGLGLAIVRHLVELHGGTVRVDSPGEGQGTTFAVCLPLLGGSRVAQTSYTSSLREQGSVGVSPTEGNSQAQLLDGLQILVVDDDADTRELLIFALSEYGANVTAATSAREALETFEQFKPDVLVSDIGMPDEDGYALIRQLSLTKQGTNIPSVALTAYARELDHALALDAGFQMHLPKPVEPEKLVAAIAYVAGRTAKL